MFRDVAKIAQIEEMIDHNKRHLEKITVVRSQQ